MAIGAIADSEVWSKMSVIRIRTAAGEPFAGTKACLAVGIITEWVPIGSPWQSGLSKTSTWKERGGDDRGGISHDTAMDPPAAIARTFSNAGISSLGRAGCFAVKE